MESYNYETVLFGRKEKLQFSPFYPGYFHLSNAFSALKGKRGKLLDVGCGQGAVSKVIKSYFPQLEVSGIDVSKASLKQAGINPSGVNFRYGSAYRIPFNNATFDVVASFDVMEHLENPSRALIEIRRVLKKGGTFIMSCPTEGNITTLHGFIWRVFGINLKEKHVGHVQMYTFRQLDRLLKKEGFKIEMYSWSNYLFNQAVDLSQYILMYLWGRKRGESLKRGSTKIRSKVLGLIREYFFKIGTFINFLESKTLFFVPGQEIHIIAKKL